MPLNAQNVPPKTGPSPSPSPAKVSPSPGAKRKLSFAEIALAIGDGQIRGVNLALKITESSLAMLVVVAHAGDLHIMNSQMQSKEIFSMVYITSIMAFPIYLLARASSAAWKRKWLPRLLDASMNLIASGNYMCMFFFLLMNTPQLNAPQYVPKQETKLNQPAVGIRLTLNLVLFLILLVEGVLHFLWPPLRKRLMETKTAKAQK